MSWLSAWNNELEYMTGKRADSVGLCSWRTLLLAVVTTGKDCLLHSAQKCVRGPALLPRSVVEIISPLFFPIFSLKVISSLDLYFMSAIKGKMKDHLYTFVVM